MRVERAACVLVAVLIASGISVAQVGRGWSDWLAPYADAQRTSWLRTDPKISVDSLSKPGFAQQWTSRLPSQPAASLSQGVTASGVTLFVPASLVASGSNTLHMVDNDTGYAVWSRSFGDASPAAPSGCGRAIAAAPTRIVSGAAEPVPPADVPAPAPGRGSQGYRSLIGDPGQGIPVEGRGGAARGAAAPPAPTPAAPAAAPAAGAARQGGAAGGGGGQASAPPAGIPGAPNVGRGGLGRAMVVYVVAGDGQLHVVGLQSGKDMQRPAPFLPVNSHWSHPVAVGTRMYAATSGTCAGAASGVYAIDLDAPDKPVVSYRTNGGSIVGAVAFSSDGNTLLAAIGPGKVTADGKANAIVALDPRTLQLRDWFSQPTAEFVTGPTVFRQGTKDVVAAATTDGRVILLDVASLGGANHATPLFVSRPIVASGGAIAAEALATWARAASATSTAPGSGTRWLLVPVSGRPSDWVGTNGGVRSGAVVALRLVEEGAKFSLEPAWASNDLTTPATPIIVNGVVFALSTGRSSAGQTGSAAVLYAYDGVSGKVLWNSGKSITTSASGGSFWSALSQVYVGASDGTVHAFGFVDERR